MREVNTRVLESWVSMHPVGVKWPGKCPSLFAEDTALVVKLSEELQKIVSEFGGLWS